MYKNLTKLAKKLVLHNKNERNIQIVQCKLINKHESVFLLLAWTCPVCHSC